MSPEDFIFNLQLTIVSTIEEERSVFTCYSPSPYLRKARVTLLPQLR